MRAVRCSGCSSERQVSAWKGGVSAWPGVVCLARGVYTSPLWTDRHLWKHNLSATAVADGKNTKQPFLIRTVLCYCTMLNSSTNIDSVKGLVLLTWVTTVRTVRSPMETLDPVTDLSTHGPIQDNITSSALGMYTWELQEEIPWSLGSLTLSKNKRKG